MKNQLLTISLLAAAAATSPAALIAHYTFDVDGTASVGTDATLGAAASITAASIVGAGALSLSGAPGTDTAGDDGAVGGDVLGWSGSDVRTVAFWVKATGGDKGDNNATMISLGSTNGAGNRFDVRLTGDTLRLEVQSGGTTTGSTIADDTWHHIAIVVPNAASVGTDVSYYIDGSLGGTFGFATAIDTNVGPLRMGDSYQDISRDLKGSLDDVRLYDSALTGAEIMALATIPEPSSAVLIGLAGMAFILRRRH